MKRLLAYLFIVLGLGLLINVKTDDIRDFKIERMYVGDLVMILNIVIQLQLMDHLQMMHVLQHYLNFRLS